MFFFNDTATTEIYTLSLHDALPIWSSGRMQTLVSIAQIECGCYRAGYSLSPALRRSEEHTSELQSRQYLVCRLLLEKKNHRLSSTSYFRSFYFFTLSY